MLDKKKVQRATDNKYVLSAEQRVALLESKVQRAEAYVLALKKEVAKKLK
jgi:hypothetical protein